MRKIANIKIILTALLVFLFYSSGFAYSEEVKSISAIQQSGDLITVTASAAAEGRDSAEVRRQVFRLALNKAAFDAFKQITFARDHNKFYKIANEVNLEKLFANAKIIDQGVDESSAITKVSATINFEFPLEKFRKVLDSYNIEYREFSNQQISLLVLMLLKNQGEYIGWYDTKFANNIAAMPSNIDRYKLEVLPVGRHYLQLISAFNLSLGQGYEAISEILPRYNVDGYNLIICESSGHLSCESHIVSERKSRRSFEYYDLGDDDLSSVISDMLEYLITAENTDDHSMIKEENDASKSLEEDNPQDSKEMDNKILINFSYSEISELLKFRRILGSSPFVADFRVARTSLNSSIFQITLLSDNETFLKSLESKGVLRSVNLGDRDIDIKLELVK